MISKIRSYIQLQIKSIDSDLREWNEPFEETNIPETLADRSYWLKYDITSTIDSQTSIEDTVVAQVKFFFKAFRDENNAYDEAMDKVNQIRLACISMMALNDFSITDQNPIIRVASLSQEGEQLETNSKQIIINLELELIINQAKC